MGDRSMELTIGGNKAILADRETGTFYQLAPMAQRRPAPAAVQQAIRELSQADTTALVISIGQSAIDALLEDEE